MRTVFDYDPEALNKLSKALRDRYLEHFSKSEDSTTRYMVAGNSNTPIPILEKLSEDNDAFVGDRARSTLFEIEDVGNMKVIKFTPKMLKTMLSYKHNDPLTSFYEWIVVELGDELRVLNGGKIEVSSVVVNPDDFQDLFKPILRKWASKKNSYNVSLSVAMYVMDVGPRTSNFCPRGEIRVASDYITDVVI